jgi:hypothetical protein
MALTALSQKRKLKRKTNDLARFDVKCRKIPETTVHGNLLPRKKMIDHPLALFNSQLNPEEKKLLDAIRNPADIQSFLDTIPYSAEEMNRSPLQVLHDRQAHCLDGGLFAAVLMRRLGFSPLILDLQPEPGQDDDHVLVLFKIDACWGAVAQSNYTGLRFREPIYRSLRELVMSYFEDFFNSIAQKTLRYYTRPINLKRFDRQGWMLSSAGVDAVEKYLKSARLIPLLTPAQTACLIDVDELSFQAGRIGINEQGVYQPKTKSDKRK